MKSTEVVLWSIRIREWREERGLTQEEFAERLGISVDAKYVSAWENGRRPKKREYVDAICQVTGLSRRDLGLVGSKRDLVHRRTFLQASSVAVGGLTAISPMLGIESTLSRQRVDGQLVDQLEKATAELWNSAARSGSVSGLGQALGHLQALWILLKGSMPASLRTRLCSAFAETGALVATRKARLGEPEAAESYFAQAIRAAQEAGDQTVGNFVLVYYTSTAPALGPYPQLRLRRFTEGDFGFNLRQATPALQSRAAAKAADLYATLRQPEACLRALEKAESAWNLARGSSESRFRKSAGDERWLLGERGASLARLGMGPAAREAIDRAMAEVWDWDLTDTMWFCLAKARTYLAEGEDELAVSLAGQAADAANLRQDSQVLQEVFGLRAALRDPAAVRQLDERLHQYQM